MPGATNHPDAELPLNHVVQLPEWHQRAALARRSSDHWTLTSRVSDLAIDHRGRLGAGRFNVGVPGPGGSIHDRLMRCHEFVEEPAAQLADTLAGAARRVQANGLGFDGRRFANTADEGAVKTVDPVIEVLAYFALALLPVRGAGTEGRHAGARQRSWSPRNDRQTFRYPTWEPPLTAAAIDALLDAIPTAGDPQRQLLGITSTWRTLDYEPRDGEKGTAGYIATPDPRPTGAT